MTKKGFLVLIMAVLISMVVFAQSSSETVYKIGDRGPADGIIFYDKGVFSDGWQYLEVAPVTTEFKSQWGGRDESVIGGTMTGLGAGKQNTTTIVYFLQNKSKPENDRAAQLCNELIYGGKEDWYLPSRDELKLMFQNLKQSNFGDFKNGEYWSSSQNGKDQAFTINFKNGKQGSRKKFDNYQIRAIRSF